MNTGVLARCPRCLLACLALAGLPGFSAASPADVDLAHLSLSQAERLLASGNPDIRLAEADVTAAGADLDIAGLRPDPQLSLSTSQISLRNADNGSGNLWQRPFSTGVQWDQPVERGGKRHLRQAVAQAALGANRNEGEATGLQQRRALVTAYYGLLRDQQKAIISAASAEAYRNSVAAAEKRLAAGDIAAVDVARLRVEAALSANDARKTASDLARSRIALAHLLGLDADADRIGADADWPDIGTPAAADPQSLVDAQPEIRAARARLESTRAAAGLARAQRQRDVTVSVSYTHAPPDLPNTVGIGVSLPLLLGNDHAAEIRRADIDVTRAEIALANTRSAMATELASDRDALESAAAIAGRFRSDVSANAEQAAAAAEFAYAHGASSLMDLLDARRTLHEVRMATLDAEAGYAISLAIWNSRLHPEEMP